MASVTKPILLDETGKQIVDAILSTDVSKARIAEINAAADKKRGEVLDSIPQDYQKTVQQVGEMDALLHGPMTDAAALLRNMSVHMDTAQRTVTVFYQTDVRTGSVIFTRKDYHFPRTAALEESVSISYDELMAANGATIAFVYDTAGRTFACRKINESSSRGNEFDHDLVLFWVYFSTSGRAMAYRAFVNDVYLDGALISDATRAEFDETTASADAGQTVIAAGHYEADKSGSVREDTNIHAGETYRIIASSRIGLNPAEPRVYLFREDGTYTEAQEDRTGMAYVWNVTIPDGYVRLRLYCNVTTAYPHASFDWAWYRIDGKRIDLLEKAVADSMGVMALLNRSTARIFRRVVCCGDSYTSGHISLDGETITANEDYAWPHYMSLITGNEWINCGCSGCNVLTWQTHERGLPAAQAAGRVQAYVIGLMINDVSNSTRAVELGTAADVGTDAQTYYGGMSAIIRRLNEISPDAKIFVNTCPRTGEKYTAYNQAVRDIVAAYQDTYPVHCIDLEAVKELYTNASLTADAVGGHYTAIGYEQFAEIYAHVLSDYINTHVSAFQNVSRIPAGQTQPPQAPAIVETEEGTLVSVSDASDMPLQGLRIFGKTTQDGTPTPEAPVPLVSVGDGGSVAEVISGKNILPWPYLNTASEQNGATFSVQDDGGIVASGTPTGYASIVLVNKAVATPGTGTLYAELFGEFANLYGAIMLYDESDTLIDTIQGTEFSIDLSQHPDAKTWRMEIKRHTDNVAVSGTVYPMVTVGDAPSAYVMPVVHQTLTLSTPNGLPGIPVTSGGNYTDADGQQWVCDEIDLERGVYVQRVEILPLDGSEYWRDSYAGIEGKYSVFEYLPTQSNDKSVKGFCTHYMHTDRQLNSSNTITGFDTTVANTIRFRPDDYASLTIEGWKERLQAFKNGGNPLTIAYALAVSVETPLPADELIAYRALHTNKPNTTIYNDAGAWQQVDYVADTKLYIDNKFTELQNAILAQGANI